MKKIYVFSAVIALTVFFTATTNAFAQVTGMPSGYITTFPTVSTETNPVWYNMMATNTDASRVNRYMYYDGTNLKTELFNSPGITDELQNDKYLWRLEEGLSGSDYVVFINKTSGKELYAESTIETNGVVGMGDTGTEWKMYDASALTSGTVAGQYAFNYEGWSDYRFLNAAYAGLDWTILVFNTTGSVAKSSGWFFYPVTNTKSINCNSPENGIVTLTATNGTATPSTIESDNSVLVGTAVTITTTPASGYKLNSITVNDEDVTSEVANNSYTVIANSDITINVSFSISTGNTDINKLSGVSVEANNLKFYDKIENSTATIIDITGKKLISSTNNSICINQLKSGVYMVMYSTTNGTKTVKFIQE